MSQPTDFDNKKIPDDCFQKVLDEDEIDRAKCDLGSDGLGLKICMAG